jgi:protein tyrosine/serine phosphatase
MGKIASGMLYRSSHPIYDGNQVDEVIVCANDAKINTVVNLSDTIRSLQSSVVCCPWYKELASKNNVIALDINTRFNIMENKFAQKIKKCILFMLEHEPPYLIHCELGTARTGFLSALLESFMGAEFEDLVKDYMLSFAAEDDYSEHDYTNGAKAIRNLFETLKDGPINTDDDLRYLSKKYFIEKAGLTDDDLIKLEKKLTNRDL